MPAYLSRLAFFLGLGGGNAATFRIRSSNFDADLAEDLGMAAIKAFEAIFSNKNV